jgi:hypothetical protein
MQWQLLLTDGGAYDIGYMRCTSLKTQKAEILSS